MASLKEEMVRASELIKTRQYDEARRLLQTLDHPTAREWLAKIDQLDPPGARPAAPEPSVSSMSGGYGEAPQSAPQSAPAYTPPPAYSTPAYNTPVQPQSGYAQPYGAQPAYGASYDAAAPLNADRRSSKLPLGGLLMVLITALIGGAFVGALLFASSLLIYLIFLSIVIAAAIAGGILSWAARRGKVRRGLPVFLLGIVMGLVVYSVYRVGEYGRFLFDMHQEVRSAIAQEMPGATPEEIDEVLLEGLEEITGASGLIPGLIGLGDLVMEDEGIEQGGFLGYVELERQAGLTITRTRGGPSNETTLSPELTLGYWVLELLIVTLTPAFMAASATSQPFCEETGRWLGFNTMGYVHQHNRNQFLSLLNQGAFEHAAQMIQPQAVRGVTITVTMGRCGPQSPEAWLRVQEQRGRNTNQIFNKPISGQQADALVNGIAAGQFVG